MPTWSLYMFLLCSEILNGKLTMTMQVMGIRVWNTVVKSLQFADNKEFFLEAKCESMTALENMLGDFIRSTGLKFNWSVSKLEK